MANYDIIGNICLMKFKREVKQKEKKKIALDFLRKNQHVTTVLEKTEKFSGRLRTQKGKWLAGVKTKEALYRENGCIFRLNVDSCYFSPRLSSERKEIADMVKKGENVLVMFSGVAPLPIVIGKMGKAKRILAVELGRECNKYALDNIRRNKLLGVVDIMGGDVRRVIGKGKKVAESFDRIVMARPNLKDSFLDVAFQVIRNKGIIHYYGFTENKKFSVPKTLQNIKRVSGYQEKDIDKLKELILEEAKKAGKRVKILGIKKAGEIGIRTYRYRADFKVY